MVEGRTGWSRAAEWYAAGLFLVYAVLALRHHGAPSLTDYANWTYQGVLLRDHLLGRPDAAHVLKLYPVPNSLITMGIGLLALVLPWLWAAKVWLVVQLALCWASMRFLLRTAAAPAVAWVVVPQAVFLNVNFWYGFMNFELALAWVMVFAACLLRGTRDWVLAILLVLVFFTHMIPLCVCLLLLAVDCRRGRKWARLWAAVPAVLLTVWYVVGRFVYAGNADGQAGMRETVRNYSAAFWAFKANSYLKSFGYVNPDGLNGAVFGRGGTAVLLVAELVLAVVAGWVMVRAGRRSGEQIRTLWVVMALLVPVFLLAPGAMLGISDPGARVLQAGLALGLALCWQSAAEPLRAVAGTAAGVLAAGGLALFVMYGGDLGMPLVGLPPRADRAEQFARVPNDDQNSYYSALQRGDLSLPVFPTGMLLNQPGREPKYPQVHGAVRRDPSTKAAYLLFPQLIMRLNQPSSALSS